MIEPSAIVEVHAVTTSGDLIRRARSEDASSSASLGPGAGGQIGLGARLFDFASVHLVGERTFFSCGAHPRGCGGESAAFGGAIRGELPRGGVRPFLEVGVQHRVLHAPAFDRRFYGSSATISWRDRGPVSSLRDTTEFTGVDTRVAVGAALRLGRGVYVDLLARVSFGSFTWFSGELHDNLDPNLPPPDGNIPPERRTLHAFYTLALALRFGGAS